MASESSKLQLDHLPMLVWSNIAELLSMQDIGACCLVSRAMRDIMNQDYVWRPRCNKELAAYLRVTEGRVEPRFVAPAHPTLSSVCDWRLCYMRELHFCNNRIQQRCIVQSFPITLCDVHITFATFINVDFLLIQTHFTSTLHLINTENMDCSIKPVTLKCNDKIVFCEIIDNSKILFVQNCWIQMYNISNPLTEPWSLIGNHMLSSRFSSAFVTGHRLVMVHIMDGTVQIFDLQKFETNKVVNLPTHRLGSPAIIIQSLSTNSSYFLVISHYFGPTSNWFFAISVYSIDQLDLPLFTKVFYNVNDITKIPNCVLYDQFLAILYEETLYIVNFLNSKILLKSPMKCIRYNSTLEEENYRIYYSENSYPNSSVILGAKCYACYTIICGKLGFKPVYISSLLSEKSIDQLNKDIDTFSFIRMLCHCPSYKPTNKCNTKLVDRLRRKIVTFW